MIWIFKLTSTGGSGKDRGFTGLGAHMRALGGVLIERFRLLLIEVTRRLCTFCSYDGGPALYKPGVDFGYGLSAMHAVLIDRRHNRIRGNDSDNIWTPDARLVGGALRSADR